VLEAPVTEPMVMMAEQLEVERLVVVVVAAVVVVVHPPEGKVVVVVTVARSVAEVEAVVEAEMLVQMARRAQGAPVEGAAGVAKRGNRGRRARM
jgi:hypothetical protein